MKASSESQSQSQSEIYKILETSHSIGKYGDAIRAEELRLKATGLLVNKTHVKHENVDSMTREQILDKLGDFMNIAQERMKDITPIPDNTNQIAKYSDNDGVDGDPQCDTVDKLVSQSTEPSDRALE